MGTSIRFYIMAYLPTDDQTTTSHRWWALSLLLVCANLQAQTTINIPACTNCTTAASGTVGSCAEALTNAQSFGNWGTANKPQGSSTSNFGGDQTYSRFFLSNGIMYSSSRYYYSYSNTQKIAYDIGAAAPLSAFHKRFPGVKIKEFAIAEGGFSTLLMISEDNDLYAMLIYNPDPYLGSGALGPNLVGKKFETDFTTFPFYGIDKLNTGTQKFEHIQFEYPISNTTASVVVFAQNVTDGLVYSWGGSYQLANQSGSPDPLAANLLMRPAANLTASVTPDPAAVINTILARNNTKLLFPSGHDGVQSTILFGASTLNPFSHFDFIGEDGAVYKIFNNNSTTTNYKVTLPGGVKAISLMTSSHNAPITNTYVDDVCILGDDGKVYVTNNLYGNYSPAGVNVPPDYPTAVDQPLTAVVRNYVGNAILLKQFWSTGGGNEGTDLTSFNAAFGGLGYDGSVYYVNFTTNTGLLLGANKINPTNSASGLSLPLIDKIYTMNRLEAGPISAPRLIAKPKIGGNIHSGAYYSYNITLRDSHPGDENIYNLAGIHPYALNEFGNAKQLASYDFGGSNAYSFGLLNQCVVPTN